MRNALMLVGLAACYTPPKDLETTPWETPILLPGEESALYVCAPERFETVICDIDGDTVWVGGCGEGEGGESVRLLGIQAPETEKPGQEGECYADEAANELARVLVGRTVTLTFDRECTDIYGRTLAYIWLDMVDAASFIPLTYFEILVDKPHNATRVMMNEYMLLAGYAYRFDEEWVDPLRYEPDLVEAERTAEVRREGLWGVCDPL